jgi:predicted DNA-binding transcriptional regulator AlpA
MFYRIVVVTVLIVAAASIALATTSAGWDHIGLAIAASAVLGARAERVIRLHELPAFLGVRKSQINEAIKAGLLHPRPAYPGARAIVVTEAEVVALQQQAAAEAAAAATTPVEIPPNRKRRLAREAAAEETHESAA